jgi:hypothetical protein
LPDIDPNAYKINEEDNEDDDDGDKHGVPEGLDGDGDGNGNGDNQDEDEYDDEYEDEINSRDGKDNNGNDNGLPSITGSGRDGLGEDDFGIGNRRKRFKTVKAKKTDDNENNGEGRPEWNLRINKPDDRKDGAWRMLDRESIHVNRS